MRAINQTIINMLKEHRAICLATNGIRPLPEKADDLAFAVLLLAVEHKIDCRGDATIINHIHESLAAIAHRGTLAPEAYFPPLEWILADQFALMM